MLNQYLIKFTTCVTPCRCLNRDHPGDFCPKHAARPSLRRELGTPLRPLSLHMPREHTAAELSPARTVTTSTIGTEMAFAASRASNPFGHLRSSASAGKSALVIPSNPNFPIGPSNDLPRRRNIFDAEVMQGTTPLPIRRRACDLPVSVTQSCRRPRRARARARAVRTTPLCLLVRSRLVHGPAVKKRPNLNRRLHAALFTDASTPTAMSCLAEPNRATKHSWSPVKQQVVLAIQGREGVGIVR